MNGLNQYTSAGPASFTYDANGNLITDGTWTYTYDVENRLIHATGAGKDVTLTYDPLGRLVQLGGSNVGDVHFLYDGDALIAEYSVSTGAMIQRYVHGSNAAADDPLVWYINGVTTGANRRYLHADHLGSIVAIADGSGALTNIDSYDEYGIPATNNSGRFGYTGQAYLYEIGLDYYKARMYSPTLGRFLQTDPIGYDGGINMYEYAADDPVDHNDPTGDAASCDGTPDSTECTHGQIGRLDASFNQKSNASQGPLHGTTRSDRQSATQIDNFVASKQGSFRQSAQGVTLSVSRNGQSIEGSISSGSHALKFTGLLSDVAGKNAIAIRDLKFQAPFGARISSAPNTIVIYNNRLDSDRIHIATDKAFTIKDALGLHTFVSQPAGDQRLNQ